MINIHHSRFRFYLVFLSIYLIYNFITRTTLLILSAQKINLDFLSILNIYSTGLFFDLISSFYLLIPVVLYLLFFPKFLYQSRFHKFLTSIFTIAVLFGFGFLMISEHVFWDEFGLRFNFIAVDYLVYTKEVIGNIKESYPIGLILSVNFLISLLVFILIRNKIFDCLKYDSNIKPRIMYALVGLALPVISFLLVSSSNLSFTNKYEKNLAYNGLYQLFSSFRNNKLDYSEFYLTKDNSTIMKNYKKLMKSNDSSDIMGENNISRFILNKDTNPIKKNVVMVVVESLSGEFIKELGDKRNLTPYFSKLVQEGMFFDNFFATGTRTVRGMEAITLSIPPTPGRSIVKRPDNQNMFSAGFVFSNLGYDTSFIYGGHGYFDNMNAFFSSNGFNNIIDRTDMSSDEITFSNVWGVCDENLFDKALQYFDNENKKDKKFFSFIMTTSNHRPYTYPAGKIDIPSKTGREGAVKYSDYALGQFMKKAKTKPWFKDTVFVIVADHNASSAGKTDIPLHKYKIPFLIYSPDFIKPQVISKLSSQIDIAPTLLALLNINYSSKFFGKNILSNDFKPRALLGNYQKLGLYRDNKLTILSSNKSVKEYKVLDLKLKSSKYSNIPLDSKDVLDTITYYQSASYFYDKKINRNE